MARRIGKRDSLARASIDINRADTTGQQQRDAECVGAGQVDVIAETGGEQLAAAGSDARGVIVQQVQGEPCCQRDGVAGIALPLTGFNDLIPTLAVESKLRRGGGLREPTFPEEKQSRVINIGERGRALLADGAHGHA